MATSGAAAAPDADTGQECLHASGDTGPPRAPWPYQVSWSRPLGGGGGARRRTTCAAWGYAVVPTDSDDRRGAPADRRRYNRRSSPESSPPYFEVFERIAVALESVASLLSARQVRLPETGPAQTQPVRPRRSADS